MFSFKRAGITEIPDIQQVAVATWPSTYEDIIGKEQVSYMLNLIYSEEALQKQFGEGHYFYFIYLDDIIAGFASFGKVDDLAWKLYKIYILPASQGTGAGSNLLDFAVKKIVSLGASQLILNVNRNNEARHFYQKKGFVITDEADIDIGNGFFMNDYVMNLALHNFE